MDTINLSSRIAIKEQKEFRHILDPMERISEILFGLIMALTFTCTLSVAESSREDVRLMLVSAISAYSEAQLDYARSLGEYTRILCSPNITLGINFLIMAAKLLRNIAPFADVEILEQHFKEKPEISGTAKKIAESLELGSEKITSLRLGGIVGHHEVIFGFPYQTVRLTHDSIKREAFGTGAAFALSELALCDRGFYTFEDLLMKKLKEQLAAH